MQRIATGCSLMILSYALFICTVPAAPIVEYQLRSAGQIYGDTDPLEIQIGEQVEVEVWARVTENEGLGLSLYELNIASSSDSLLAVAHPDDASDWNAAFEVTEWSISKRGDLAVDQQGISEHRAAWLAGQDDPTPDLAAEGWDKLSYGMFEAMSPGSVEVSIDKIWNTTVYQLDNSVYGTVEVSEGNRDAGDLLAILAVPEPSSFILFTAAALAVLYRRRRR